jgi:tRNA(Ile)-lysidine synthase
LLSAPCADFSSPAKVDALLAPLEGAPSLVVAVSGGPDSTALLLMVAEWAARRGTTRIAAATVDHGLRPESGAEAQSVADLCARLGVPHAILQWTGAKPSTRLQERAREARYRLLVEHARAIGADTIVTAHHADDQAETVLFRLMRGSGVAGLRGMEPMSRRNGVSIARPLLGVTKSALVAFAGARGAAFVQDPSNAELRFARPRLRALIAGLAGEGLSAEGLARLARRAAEADEALARMTAEVEARIGAEGPIDARALFEAPLAIVQRILARRIAAAGGRDLSRIGLEKIEALALRLRDASLEGRAFKANVGGAVVRLIAAGKLEFSPEPARRVAAVMAGLDPATQVAQPPQRRKSTRVDSAAGSRGLDRRKSVDGRLEPGHDE